jgi:uncharacterized protein (DUF2235 family)
MTTLQVRSVAGMINNFGILKTERLNGEDDAALKKRIKALCGSVYDMFRNRDPAYSPSGEFAQTFRASYSHPFSRKTPAIRFLGLFDTVGSLGVPTLQAGTRPQYEFYDQVHRWLWRSVCAARIQGPTRVPASWRWRF